VPAIGLVARDDILRGGECGGAGQNQHWESLQNNKQTGGVTGAYSKGFEGSKTGKRPGAHCAKMGPKHQSVHNGRADVFGRVLPVQRLAMIQRLNAGLPGSITICCPLARGLHSPV
jgi:hypothetical protein